MKKLIVAAFLIAGFSFASNAQTSPVTAASHTTAKADIGKRQAKKTSTTQVNATKSTTSTAAVKKTGTSGKKKSTKKAAKKTAKKAAKKAVKKSSPAKKTTVKKATGNN